MKRRKRRATPSTTRVPSDHTTARLTRVFWYSVQEISRWYGVIPAHVLSGTKEHGLRWYALGMDLARGTYHEFPELEKEAAEIFKEEMSLRLRLNAWTLKLPGMMEELARLKPEGIPTPNGIVRGDDAPQENAPQENDGKTKSRRPTARPAELVTG